MLEILENYDYEIIVILQGALGYNSSLDKAVTLFASDYLIPVSVGLLIIYSWFGTEERSVRLKHQLATVTAVVSLAMTNLSILILNNFLFRPRPYDSYEVEVFFYLPTDSSFPANSVASIFALTVPFLFSRIPIGLTLVCCSIVLGIARVLVGVHYPTDILGAILLAAAISSVITVIFSNYRTKLEKMVHFAQRILLA